MITFGENSSGLTASIGSGSALILLVTEFAKQRKLEAVNTEKLGKSKRHKLKQIRYIRLKCFVFSPRRVITKIRFLVEMLRASIGHKPNEVLFVIFLYSKNEYLTTKELGEGTVSQASAFPCKIVEEALKQKATSIILAHNHPCGIDEPSEHDESIRPPKGVLT